MYKRQKYCSFALTVIFTRILIAKSPEINATIVGPNIAPLRLKDDSAKVRSQAPKIVGIPSSNEKYIASVFFIPRYIPVNKVTPDLDTPGIRANA